MNRMNIVCLGVRDMKRSIAFYRDGLGFKTKEKGDNPEVIFFDAQGTKLELFPIKELIKDIGLETDVEPRFSGITLAYNGKSKAEVDDVFQHALDVGAKCVKMPEEVFWGGYSGYFSDPDGYIWEVAYGPRFEYDENDMLIM